MDYANEACWKKMLMWAPLANDAHLRLENIHIEQETEYKEEE